MEKRLSNIFKTTNVTKLIKAILKSSYRVLQVTFKGKKIKQPVYFLRAVAFWSTFDIQISITFATFWEKLQNYSFKNPTEVSQNTPTFKKNETFVFFGGSFFKIKIADILNF